MKKIIFGVFALAFTFSAQAVYVTWAALGVCTPDLSVEGVTWTKTIVTQTDEYIEYLWKADFSTTQLKNAGSASITINEGTSGKTAFTYIMADDGYNKDGWLAGKTDTSIPASAIGLYAIIIVTYNGWTVEGTKYFDTNTSSGAANINFSGQWTKTTIEYIPEPATLAIFGVGVAALGLYRRRRK